MGLIASTLLLLAVYFTFPGTNAVEIESTDRPQLSSLDNQPLDPQAASDAPAAVEKGVQNSQLGAFSLPTQPRKIETKSEQGKLLANVEAAAAQFPQNASVMHLAAITYAELLQTDKAAAFFEKSLELDKRSPPVWVDYAGLLLKTGKQQAAVDLLSQPALSVSATPEWIDALGNALMQLGELDRAAETLDAGATKFADDAALRMRLAQVQLQLQQFEAAEKNARAAIDLGLNGNAAYTTLSSALIRLGRREEALQVRSQAIAAAPQNQAQDEQYERSFQEFASHTYGLLAGIYRANRQPADAESCLMNSVELAPDSATSLLAFADLLYQQQRAADAIAVYQRLIEVQPQNLYNYNNLASLAVSTGNVPLAEDSLRRATQIDSTGNATLRLADFLLRLGNFPEATSQAQAAVKQLRNADAYLVWISALKADGKTAAALAALIQARETLPSEPRLKNFQL